jgi:hypothetical protein
MGCLSAGKCIEWVDIIKDTRGYMDLLCIYLIYLRYIYLKSYG